MIFFKKKVAKAPKKAPKEVKSPAKKKQEKPEPSPHSHERVLTAEGWKRFSAQNTPKKAKK